MVVLGHLNMVFKALEMGFRPCEKPFYVLIHIVQCFGVPTTKSLGVYQSLPSLSIPEFPFFSPCYMDLQKNLCSVSQLTVHHFCNLTLSRKCLQKPFLILLTSLDFSLSQIMYLQIIFFLENYAMNLNRFLSANFSILLDYYMYVCIGGLV